MADDTYEKRTGRIYIRVTESERALIRMKMEENGYASLSSYLRGILSKGTTRLTRRTQEVDARELERQYRQTIFEIQRMGGRYNEAVKAVQEGMRILEGGHGAQVPQVHLLDRRMRELMRMTRQVRDAMMQLVGSATQYAKREQITKQHIDMQEITLTGNLVADAKQLRKKNDELFVAFTVACKERRGDSETVTYYDVTYRNDNCFDYLRQGKRVLVKGLPEAKAYISKDGNAIGTTVVRAYTLELQ